MIAQDVLLALANLSVDALVGTSDYLTVRRNVQSAIQEISWTNAGVSDWRRDQPPSPAADALFEIRQLAAVTWSQLAQLMGVDRRSVHAWASGRRLSSRREARLYDLLAAAREHDHGNPSATRRALFAALPPDAVAPLDEDQPSIRSIGLSEEATARALRGPHPLDRMAHPE